MMHAAALAGRGGSGARACAERLNLCRAACMRVQAVSHDAHPAHAFAHTAGARCRCRVALRVQRAALACRGLRGGESCSLARPARARAPPRCKPSLRSGRSCGASRCSGRPTVQLWTSLRCGTRATARVRCQPHVGRPPVQRAQLLGEEQQCCRARVAAGTLLPAIETQGASSLCPLSGGGGNVLTFTGPVACAHNTCAVVAFGRSFG